MRYEVTEGDFQILTSVLSLLREKGGYNPSITRMDIVRETGLSNQLIGSKIKNSYLKEKQLKERIA